MIQRCLSIKKYLLLFLFSNLFVSVSCNGENQCLDLFRNFRNPSWSITDEDPYMILRNVFVHGSGDLTLLIHQAVLKIAADFKYHGKIKDFVQELVEIDRARLLLRPQFLINHSDIIFDPMAKNIQLTKFLLTLIEGDLSLWQGVLTKSQVQSSLEDFDNYRTLGHMMTLMPMQWKSKALQFLARKYALDKSYAMIQPIHTLMNPNELYWKYRREGKSDREFYNDYLKMIKRDVFSEAVVGGYSGDMVIDVARVIQSEMVRLKNKGIKAVNFFGSVVNGFGRPQSDLDLFNHPIESDYPSLVEQRKISQLLRLRQEDPFDKYRYQIKDSVLQEKIDKKLIGSGWQWQLEDKGQTATEHFGASSHVFVFHITQDRIVLRFYPHYLRVDYAGNSVNYREFIELDID